MITFPGVQPGLAANKRNTVGALVVQPRSCRTAAFVCGSVSSTPSGGASCPVLSFPQGQRMGVWPTGAIRGHRRSAQLPAEPTERLLVVVCRRRHSGRLFLAYYPPSPHTKHALERAPFWGQCSFEAHFLQVQGSPVSLKLVNHRI